MKNAKKRSVVVGRFDDSGDLLSSSKRVRLMSNRESYRYIMDSGEKWCVDLLKGRLRSPNVLLEGKFSDCWFYDDGCNVLMLAEGIRDDYYQLAESRFSSKVLDKLWNVYRYLISKGSSVDSIYYFKRIDNRYYLMNGSSIDTVFNDDKTFVKLYNEALLGVFAEKRLYYEVICLPTRSDDFFFENIIVAYNTYKDFKKACESWGLNLCEERR